MKTISTPDHSDFQKARTALLTTSVVLFILTRMNLQSDAMDIFGLKVGISKDEIVFFWRLVVTYFIYIFILRCIVEWSNDIFDAEIDEQKDWLNMLDGDYPTIKEFLAKSEDPENASHELRLALIPKLQTKIRMLRLTKVMADFLPPFLVAAMSLLSSLG